MEGDVAGSQSAAAHARNLQPSGRSQRSDLDAPVSQDDLRRMSVRHGRQSRRLQQNVDRRLKDEQLLLLLAQDDFQGSRYDLFVEELVRYGISVLRGWMHSGFIFQLVAHRGFGLNPHELDLEELATHSEVREELASMTVARALPRFRQKALVEGGWSFEGGASITTYFMGACLYSFPNEFRRHRADAERQRRSLKRQQAVYENPVSPRGTAEDVLGRLWVREELNNIADPRTRTVVALTLDDYTQEEIQQLLDEKSVRVIEGLLYRWRKKSQRHQGGGQHG
ncbi:hypothetical protein [Streptomyces sp. CdTB01]|uniref:hypothetical protein n=1 Tax=Streptomyces sp. CdTB01 TaxID=1725411 RepID=UPI00073A6072|nr:hypothetical protein [Streptomyces sp. CdTB01]ALV30834.1 hypothetical protein AS200_01050 [Streptomyces sp. CdTB01]